MEGEYNKIKDEVKTEVAHYEGVIMSWAHAHMRIWMGMGMFMGFMTYAMIDHLWDVLFG